MAREYPAELRHPGRELYESLEVKASACVECGICVERCPFGVDIMAKLQEAVELFETTAS